MCFFVVTRHKCCPDSFSRSNTLLNTFTHQVIISTLLMIIYLPTVMSSIQYYWHLVKYIIVFDFVALFIHSLNHTHKLSNLSVRQNFPECKVTSSICFFCPANSPKPEDSMFSEQILAFNSVEPAKVPFLLF